MSDVNGVAEIEMLDNRRSVGGIMVHIVTVANLTRAPVPAPVDSDHAVPSKDEEQHLRVPVVGA